MRGGEEGRRGRVERPEGLVWSLSLLLVFMMFIRTLGHWARPADGTLDCGRVAADDLPALERCIDIRPGDVELLAALAGAYEQTAEWERAEALYRRALAVDEEDGDIRVRLAHLLLRRGDPAGARREGMRALAVQPGRGAALEVVSLADAEAGVR